MSSERFEAVIGLEVHVQLQTRTKIFCDDSTTFGGHDNEHICPVCSGMPGSLPVLNERAVEFAVRAGLALGCEVSRHCVFARKQYFYPDLPKGYQISQFDRPLCENGEIEFLVGSSGRKKVKIVRAHMEEDAGKSTHHGEHTLINLNRAGIPLLEIVSGPDMRSATEAAEYARAIRNVVRYLDICDGNLEEGSLRCDCNVSIREPGQPLGTKVEIKNINSFRFIEKAIEYEIQRQIDCKESGEKIVQETRLYDPDKNRTFSMRSKEEAHDYRYFPDPDLLPLEVDEKTITRLREDLPELPLARADRFIIEYRLSDYDAFTLTQEREMADYFEQVALVCQNPKAAANWVMSDLTRELNESKRGINQSPIAPEYLGQMIRLIDRGSISGKIAKVVFAEMWASGRAPDEIVREKGLIQITDLAVIEKMVENVLTKNPSEVDEYRNGKEKLFGFFVGQVMKTSKGQASPEVVNELLKKKLKS